MSKIIPLTKGKQTIVDDEDFDCLSKFKWCYSGSGYAVRGAYKKDSNQYLMHRMIMNTPRGLLTDHINGDKLDNRRENLRICTKSENMRNDGLRTNNKTGYKGVSWNKSAKKYSATLTINDETIHVGYFKTPEKAAQAYDLAAKVQHGEFAKTNFNEDTVDTNPVGRFLK